MPTVNTTNAPQKSPALILDEIEQRASKASPGPWKKCSASEGKCRCQAIWSVPADAPVCECNDKWGDPFASLRFVNGDSAGSIGAKVEAYEDMIEYGDIGEEAKQANKNFIAASRTDVPALVKALRRAMVWIHGNSKGLDHRNKVLSEITAILEGKEQPQDLGEPGATNTMEPSQDR